MTRTPIRLWHYFMLIAYFALFLYVAGMIHEIIHLIMFKLADVKVLEIKILNPLSGALFAIAYDPTSGTPIAITLSRYTGGLISGALLLLLYFSLRNRFDKGDALNSLMIGVAIFGIAGFQIAQGVVEGGFPDLYRPSLLGIGPSTWIQAVGGLIAMLLFVFLRKR